MRKTTLGISFALLSINVFGQIKTSEISLENTDHVTNISVPSKEGQNEDILHLSISDASPDFLKVGNATGINGRFIPTIRGYHTTSNQRALNFTGLIESINDTGNEPIIVFDSRINGAAVSTRPLFAWNTFGNRKMTLQANGYLGIGINNPASTLHIETPDKDGSERLLQLSISDASDDYFLIRNSTSLDNQFIPQIKSYHASDNRPALFINGEVNPENDTGSKPIITFNAHKTGAAIETRPLFAWRSHISTKMTLAADGSLGIGTNNPEALLHIETPETDGGENLLKLNVSDASDDYLVIKNSTGIDNQFIPQIRSYHTSDNRSSLYLTGEVAPNNDTGTEPIVIFNALKTGATVDTRPLFAWKSFSSTKMTLLANGNLGIGKTNPNHQLDVNGSINASSYYNDGTSQWPDFVFSSDYILPTLEEVENHIEKHGHLENIPSEEEVAKYGYNMGELDTKLLEKVEELTLYLIDMNKQLEAQNKRIETLEKENEKLKRRRKS